MTPDPQNDADADIYAADVVEHLALVGETDARKWAATSKRSVVTSGVTTWCPRRCSRIVCARGRLRRNRPAGPASTEEHHER